MWEQGYFKWLCGLVECPDEYTTLLRCLDGEEFRFSMRLDGNRAVDGVMLRSEYGGGSRGAKRFGPCTVLEMLIGTLKRADEMYVLDAERSLLSEWFWETLAQLDLLRFSDPMGLSYGRSWDVRDVRARVDLAMDRRYGKDGADGFWCVPGSLVDERKMDLWNQFARWVAWRYSDECSIDT
ncbi:MAG: hypothetical protein J6S63_06735 [Atopobiaceae bacterium]|nr:hypothetical protein [Atopobiaceae bacterium]